MFYDCPVTYFQYHLALLFGDVPVGNKKPSLYLNIVTESAGKLAVQTNFLSYFKS